MTTALTTPVRLTAPTQWFSSVPHLLGFHPTDSVVVVGVRRHGDRSRAVIAVRCDLPSTPGPGARDDLARELLTALSHAPDTEVILFVIGGAAGDGPPHADLATRVIEACETSGRTVLHALWAPATVGGDEWLCYLDRTCRGVVADYAVSALGAASAAAGQVTFADRASVAAVIDPDPPDLLAVRERRLAGLLSASEPDPRYLGDGSAAWGLAVVTDSVDRFRDQAPALDEDEICRLAIALADPLTRDAAAGLIETDAPAARRLFTALTRAVPGRHRAGPAVLLALTAYRGGDGVFARIALDAALAADPDYRLAVLLSTVLSAGMPPTAVERVIRAGTRLAREIRRDPQGESQ